MMRKRQVQGQAHAGDFVVYEDTANAPRAYMVCGLMRRGTVEEYELRDVETGQRRTSDLRQGGWTFLAVAGQA